MGHAYLKWTSSVGAMILGKEESTHHGEDSRFNLCSSLCPPSSGYHGFVYKERGSKRGQRVIVATGPAIDHAPVLGTGPLTKHDLIHYFVSGCKPKENWR